MLHNSQSIFLGFMLEIIVKPIFRLKPSICPRHSSLLIIAFLFCCSLFSGKFCCVCVFGRVQSKYKSVI